jgi:hypothetical protein
MFVLLVIIVVNDFLVIEKKINALDEEFDFLRSKLGLMNEVLEGGTRETEV